MNPTIDFLRGHVSVRQFTDRTISDEEAELILTTAQCSPTSSNLQAYSIVSVRSVETKARLAELAGNQEHVAKCSLFLVFCADLYRLSLLNAQRDYPFQGDFAEIFMVATVDATLVAGRALMAAQALGMSGVMVGAIRNNISEVSVILELPRLVYPVMGMSLGWPAVQTKPKPRLPLGAVHFREKYQPDVMGGYIAEYDRTVAEIGHLRGRELHPEKYSGFRGTYSWSEHSARRLADSSPTTVRPHMLSYLRERGFLKK
jgi:FMN reductase (NADPH)